MAEAFRDRDDKLARNSGSAISPTYEAFSAQCMVFMQVVPGCHNPL